MSPNAYFIQDINEAFWPIASEDMAKTSNFQRWQPFPKCDVLGLRVSQYRDIVVPNIWFNIFSNSDIKLLYKNIASVLSNNFVHIWYTVST